MKIFSALLILALISGCYKTTTINVYDYRMGLGVGQLEIDINNGSLSPHAKAEGNTANLDNLGNGNELKGERD